MIKKQEAEVELEPGRKLLMPCRSTLKAAYILICMLITNSTSHFAYAHASTCSISFLFIVVVHVPCSYILSRYYLLLPCDLGMGMGMGTRFECVISQVHVAFIDAPGRGICSLGVFLVLAPLWTRGILCRIQVGFTKVSYQL